MDKHIGYKLPNPSIHYCRRKKGKIICNIQLAKKSLGQIDKNIGTYQDKNNIIIPVPERPPYYIIHAVISFNCLRLSSEGNTGKYSIPKYSL